MRGNLRSKTSLVDSELSELDSNISVGKWGNGSVGKRACGVNIRGQCVRFVCALCSALWRIVCNGS